MSNVMSASAQWANRPADERFWGLDDMRASLLARQLASREMPIELSKIKVVPTGSDLSIAGQNHSARLTNWSFGQLCSRVKAPAYYLRTLPGQMAADCLNQGLSQPIQGVDSGDQDRLLLHQNGDLSVRALTSDKYSRIFDVSVIDALRPALDLGWQVPPARPACEDVRSREATISDILPGQEKFGLSVKVGDLIAPAGCYAGDRDMFILLVNPERVLDDGSGGNGAGLLRAVMIRNSEVKGASFSLQCFLLENICGNHILWGAHEVTNVKIIHRGEANVKFGGQLHAGLLSYEKQAGVEENMVQAARRFTLGHDKASVTETLFGNRAIGLSKRAIEASYDLAVVNESVTRAAPTTAWGFVHGLTRYSQTVTSHADQRRELDSAGGKILALAN